MARRPEVEFWRPRSRRNMVNTVGGVAAALAVLFVGVPSSTHWTLAPLLTTTVPDSPLPPTYPPLAPDTAPTTAATVAETVVSTAETAPTTTISVAVEAVAPVQLEFSHPIPPEVPAAAPAAPPPAWAASAHATTAGYIATDVGCAANLSAAGLDSFFAQRLGPAIGLDYQHVYPLGGNRYLWLLQDTFVDQPGVASRLDQASFVHNAALVQRGSCFSLFHRGSTAVPTSFEPGTGERRLAKWFWPLGGETFNGQLTVFWAEMEKDGYEPPPGEGLGWHPRATWVATYDATTLARLDFRPAPNPGATPLYGYAVASQGDFTYLFANTFEQNLTRDGGWANQPHSGTAMWLARVPRGQLLASPEYRTTDGWSTDSSAAVAIMQRFRIENPLQPRWLGGQWVAATKRDGYWGEQLVIDVAANPWGPWTTTETRTLVPRGADPLMNTYHAHLMPWLDEQSRLVVSVSQNARDMLRDAWPSPQRYRPQFVTALLVAPPTTPEPPPTSAPPTTTAVSTTPPATTAPPTTAPATTSPPTTGPTTTTPSVTTSTTTTTTTTPPATSPSTTTTT